MRSTLWRVLWVISGVLLMAAGVTAILNPSVALTSLALLIGISMLISGIIDLVIFAETYKLFTGSGWILADGILSVILSLILLCNHWITAALIPFVFGMWVLFTGIAKLISSLDMKRLGIPGWGWFTALGVLLIVFGVISFFKPVAAAVAAGILTGIALILEGAVAILKGLFSRRFFS